MKKVQNRMAAVETREEQETLNVQHPTSNIEPRKGACPKCGGVTVILSERMVNSRAAQQRMCEQCQVFFSTGV